MQIKILFASIIFVLFSSCASTRARIADSIDDCESDEVKIVESTETIIADEYAVECRGVKYKCSKSPVHFSCTKR